MNKWLERALISAGAAVVSTTAIVTTAERPGKRKKRKDKRKGEKDSRGKDGALVDDEVPRSVGAQAAHDYRVGHDGGITAGEFLANVRDASKNAASRVSTVGGYLLGRQKAPPPEDGERDDVEVAGDARARQKEAKQAPKRKKVRRRVRRKTGDVPRDATARKKKRGRRREQAGDETVDELRELRDEAVKRAASAAAKHAADKTGFGGAARQIKESGEELWKKTEKLGKAVKDRVPEDLGDRVGDTLGEAGKGIARGARALSERLRAAMSEEEARERRASDDEQVPGTPRAADEPPAARAADAAHESSDEERPVTARAPDATEEASAADLADRVGRGLKGFARWVEGPGAPGHDDEQQRKRSRRARRTTVVEADVVEAKDPDGEAPDVVSAKDPEGPPPDVVDAKDPPEGP